MPGAAAAPRAQPCAAKADPAPDAAPAPRPGDEFDRRLGAKSFGGGSDEDEEDEDEEGLPELDSDDIVAEADSGACTG